MLSNGKWQLAFWIVTVVAGVWLVCITSGMVANDRLRVAEDKEIRADLSTQKAERLLQYAEIIARLTRIETKLENSR